MALKCWCLEFQPQDHSFLLQSKVFANISEALSGMEDTEGDQVKHKDQQLVSKGHHVRHHLRKMFLTLD